MARGHPGRGAPRARRQRRQPVLPGGRRARGGPRGRLDGGRRRRRRARCGPRSRRPSCARSRSGSARPASCGPATRRSSRPAPRSSEAAWAALPLRVRGRTVGALGIGFAGAHPFDEEERGFIEALAHQCAQAVDRARLYETQRELRAQAEDAAETRELLVRELRRTLRERDESAALLDALFGNAPVGLALLDREMRYLTVNAHLARLNGAPAERLLGRTLWETAPRVARDDLVRDFAARWRRGARRCVERTVVAPPRVPGETQRTFVVTLYPVTRGRPAHRGGRLVREVTEQRVAEQSRRHVLGVVGHDLRSPLMAITASAELLASGPLDERAARSVGRILRASGRIDGIIRALVDYTAVQGGPGIELHPRRTDLAVAGPRGGRGVRGGPRRAHGPGHRARAGARGVGRRPDRAGGGQPGGQRAPVQPGGHRRSRWPAGATAEEAVVEVTNAGRPHPRRAGGPPLRAVPARRRRAHPAAQGARARALHRRADRRGPRRAPSGCAPTRRPGPPSRCGCRWSFSRGRGPAT